MSQEMMDKTCRGFAEALAAREPVPGGGSASAFVGALGRLALRDGRPLWGDQSRAC